MAKTKVKVKKISDDYYVGERFSIIKKENHWSVVDNNSNMSYKHNTFVDAYKRILESP